MTVALALLVAVANLFTGAYGAWRWYRVLQAPRFWTALRVTQAVTVLFAVYGTAIYFLGDDGQGLFLLYAALPVAVNVVAEQLRIATAETVLDARGLPNAAALGERPDAEQRSVVTQILRRELGVMTAATLVVAFLALRAAGTV